MVEVPYRSAQIGYEIPHVAVDPGQQYYSASAFRLMKLEILLLLRTTLDYFEKLYRVSTEKFCTFSLEKMTAALHFTLRPLERRMPVSALEGGFRVQLSIRDLKALGLETGDLCRLSSPGGAGLAIAWL